MELRYYQQEAIAAVFAKWQQQDKVLLVMSTGSGKTIVFAHIAQQLVNQGKRVLILAHRNELLTQAQEKIYHATGLTSGLEKAEHTSIGSDHAIVVASVQTMQSSKRLDLFGSDAFEYIIVDETHHILARSYQKVLNFFNQAKVLGVTATPERGDKKVLGTYFGEDTLAYEYTIEQGIKDGYLSPIHVLSLPLKIDLRAVKLQAGDYQASGVSAALEPYLDGVVEAIMQHCQGRKILIFLPLVQTAQKMRDLLLNKGITAAEINGSTPKNEREQLLTDFAQGKYQVLTNATLLSEGFDLPSIDCIINLRATKSRSLYMQIIGRGLRTAANKQNLLLVDFLWQTKKYNLIKPAHIFTKTERATRKLTQYIEKKHGVVDLEASLVEALAAESQKDAEFINLQKYWALLDAFNLKDYEPAQNWEFDPITLKQQHYLQKYGIKMPAINTKGIASAIINAINMVKHTKPATSKQIAILKKYNVPNADKYLFVAALQKIAKIKEKTS